MNEQYERDDYEWVVRYMDAHGDTEDHAFFEGSVQGAFDALTECQAALDRGESAEVDLWRSNGFDRDIATVEGDALPSRFDGGGRVPAHYRRQLRGAVAAARRGS